MFDRVMAQTGLDESSRCQERAWLSIEEEKRYGIENLVNMGEYQGGLASVESDNSYAHFNGLIPIGQKVYLPDDELIGLTTKLFLNPSRKISHLAVRTARLLGRHKMVPISSVRDVTSLRVQLSITREQFQDLPEYQADSAIAEAVDRALWNDVVLRDTDYYAIDVRVRDGIITLNGHVITSMNQWRAQTAVKNIPGILGLKSYLIPDDKLILEVSKALSQIEQNADCKIFTKVENGLVILVGEASSLIIRNQVEQCVAEIPWVRGIINEIYAPGMDVVAEEQRFLQPLIGKELIFKDALSITTRKVVINPHNRRVIAVVGLGRFPASARQDKVLGVRGESNPERLVLLPVGLILHLTRSVGYLRINSDETTEYEDFDVTRYITPDKNWSPPYPYCTDEVLFPVQ